MANVNGTNYAKSIDPSPSNIVDPGVLGGRVRVMIDDYECAALASGAAILVGKQLQAGARIVNVQLFFDALGSSTVHVGDEGDADRYLNDISVSSAGAVDLCEDDNVDGFQYEVTGTTDNVIRITNIGGATMTGTIKIAIYYTED